MKNEKKKDLSTFVSCAMVFKTTLREFDRLKEIVTNDPYIHLIYQRASLEKLYIVTEKDRKEVQA